MNSPAAIRVTAVRVAELLAEGEPMPVYVHVIDHPDARVLVDTGMTQLHPAVADMEPRLYPLNEQDFDIGSVDIVINTHLHSTTEEVTTSSRASPPTSSVRNSTTPATRARMGKPARGCTTSRSTAGSNGFPGYGSFRHRVTPGAHRLSSLKEADAPPSSRVTQQSGSTNLITPAPRGSS